MAFDFKKEYKEFYSPKNKPEIVNVPSANYIAVRGVGNPNEEGGAYQQAIGVLYAVAYTLKMSYKTDYKIEGFFEYVVPPLEGFWWQDGICGIDYSDKSTFHWISVIRLPDFVSTEDFEWAVKTAAKKKKIDCSSAKFLTVDEGLCVQMMHTGPLCTLPCGCSTPASERPMWGRLPTSPSTIPTVCAKHAPVSEKFWIWTSSALSTRKRAGTKVCWNCPPSV